VLADEGMEHGANANGRKKAWYSLPFYFSITLGVEKLKSHFQLVIPIRSPLREKTVEGFLNLKQ
jgi:hypothetical protein